MFDPRFVDPRLIDKQREALELLAARAGYRDRKSVANLIDMALASKNEHWLERIASSWEAQAALNTDDISPFGLGPSADELPQGEISLGSLGNCEMTDSELVTLPFEYLDKGVFVGGGTGVGKSFLIAYLCGQLIDSGEIKVMIFDRKGRGEFHKLLANYIRSGQLLVLDYKDLKRNLLEVLPGEQPKETINRVADITRGAFYWRDGTCNLVASVLTNLYSQYAVFDGSHNYPSIQDLAKALEKLKFHVNSRNAGYWETAINRLTNLLNQMPETYVCSQGYNIGELLDRNIIWRLGGLSDALYRLFVQDLLNCILVYRAIFPVRWVSNLVCIDELHLLTAGSPFRDDLSEAFLNRFARLTRSSGTGLLSADQVISQIPSAILANMGTRIILRLTNGPCIRTVAASMSLDSDKASYIARLESRQAVLHYPGYPEPFLIRIPNLLFDEQITEEEVKELMAPKLAAFKRVPRSECAVIPEQPKSSQVPKEQIDYLVGIRQHYFMPVSKLAKILNLSAYKENAIRARLEEAGFLKTHKMSFGRHGSVALIEILPKGYDYLDALGVKYVKPKGKGSWLHKFWQWKICSWLRGKFPNANVQIEDDSNGKLVDVSLHLASLDGSNSIAYEILIEGESKEVVNVIKDLQAGYSKVVICAESTSQLEAVKREVQETLKTVEWVSFQLLSEFL